MQIETLYIAHALKFSRAQLKYSTNKVLMIFKPLNGEWFCDTKYKVDQLPKLNICSHFVQSRLAALKLRSNVLTLSSPLNERERK